MLGFCGKLQEKPLFCQNKATPAGERYRFADHKPIHSLRNGFSAQIMLENGSTDR